jgi:molecular chaperone GrpE
MSESSPPPGLTDHAAVPGPPALTDALAGALADFRRWYEHTLASNGAVPVPPAPATVDLATLLGHFIGLRQEINLQTRSVRAQQEQTAERFAEIQDALAELTPSEPAGVSDEEIRSLLKALIDLHDNLSLAGQQIQRTRVTVLPLLDDLVRDAEECQVPEAPPPAQAPRSFWSRWFLSPAADAALARVEQERHNRHERSRKAREGLERIRDALDALVTGYTMSLERIDRALTRQGLERIETVGRTFDPEQMEALDTVPGSGRPSGEVHEEVRRGYLWGGRVFRYAQVRVARG